MGKKWTEDKDYGESEIGRWKGNWKTCIKLYGKLLWTVITIIVWYKFEELSQCNDVASIN